MPLALATPLLVPFAEAAGITIAAVATAAGATILQDKIQDYMQENPEKSKRILDVIMATMPGGLGDIFLKEEITTNDGEEMTEEESVDDRSTKEIVLDALGKKKGNYSSPDAEGNYSSKRGRIIKALEKSGTVETGPNKDYDSSKKYKGYKKFFNEGGLAGTKTYHQVRDLTVPQDLEGIMNYKTGGRVNLNIGGNPEDQYGLQYDDQEVGIINTDNQMAFRPNSMKDKGLRQLDVMPDMNQKRYDNLRKEDVEQFNEKGIPLSLPKDRYKGIEGYTAMAIDPNRMTDAYSGFRNNITSPIPEDYDMQYTVGNEFNVTPQQTMFDKAKDFASSGLAKAGKTTLGIYNLLKNNNPAGLAMSGIKGIGNFFQGNPRQQARNADNKQFGVGDIYGYGMGGQGIGNKDAFGFNTVSGFGDYEQHMIDTVEKLEGLLTKTGRTGFKPGTPNFNKLNDYSKNIAVINEKARIAAAQEESRFDRMAAEQLRAANTGYTNRGTRIDFGNYYNADGTANTSSASNPANSVGPTSNFGMAARAAKGGLIGYQNGGLASMFMDKK